MVDGMPSRYKRREMAMILHILHFLSFPGINMKSASLFSVLVVSALFVGSSLAITLTDPSQLTTTIYDYIIVGGTQRPCRSMSSGLDIGSAGNAGLVLANRLTENSTATVLVLEAGVR